MQFATLGPEKFSTLFPLVARFACFYDEPIKEQPPPKEPRMRELQAYKFAPSVIVAATSAEHALEVLHSHPDDDYRDLFPTTVPILCSDWELDEGQTCTNDKPAPTIRQRLEYIGQAGFLLDYEGGSWAKVPSSLWEPPAEWHVCSPQLLSSGVNCATAPRWCNGNSGQHWHPAPTIDQVG